MSKIIGVMAKENTGVDFAGKQSSAVKSVLGSVSKRTKALTDVKNTFYSKNTSAPGCKKHLTFDENQINSGKKELQGDRNTNFQKMPVPLNRICLRETDKGVLSVTNGTVRSKTLPLIQVTASVVDTDDDEFDIDDCPSCYDASHDDTDWVAEYDWPKLSTEEIRGFCCDPFPCFSPGSPVLTSKQLLEMVFEPVPPPSPEKINLDLYSPKFNLSNEMRNMALNDIIPVTNDD